MRNSYKFLTNCTHFADDVALTTKTAPSVQLVQASNASVLSLVSKMNAVSQNLQISDGQTTAANEKHQSFPNICYTSEWA